MHRKRKFVQFCFDWKKKRLLQKGDWWFADAICTSPRNVQCKPNALIAIRIRSTEKLQSYQRWRGRWCPKSTSIKI